MWLIVVVPSPARLCLCEASGGRVLDVTIAQQELDAAGMWQPDVWAAKLNQWWKQWIVKVEDANHIAGRFDD